MGLRTLEEFREDLSVAIGGRGPSNRWLDRRINAGYIDLSTSILHEALRCCATITTIAGESRYLIGGDAIGVVSVMDLEGERKLVFIENENLDFYKVKGGRPQLWSRQGRDVRFWPTPDVEMDLTVTYYREPLPLVEDGDVTIIEARWDQGIHLMACHFGFLDLDQGGEGGRAGEYLDRARIYISSKVTDMDVRRSPTMPTPVPNTIRELTRLRTRL